MRLPLWFRDYLLGSDTRRTKILPLPSGCIWKQILTRVSRGPLTWKQLTGVVPCVPCTGHPEGENPEGHSWNKEGRNEGKKGRKEERKKKVLSPLVMRLRLPCGWISSARNLVCGASGDKGRQSCPPPPQWGDGFSRREIPLNTSGNIWDFQDPRARLFP